MVNTDRCKGCSLCVVAAPKIVTLARKAVNVHGYSYAEAVHLESALVVLRAESFCPDGCITVYREKMED